ncbi:hypothetical protein ACFQ07_27660, partial [Actinomadura adrarensis]
EPAEGDAAEADAEADAAAGVEVAMSAQPASNVADSVRTISVCTRRTISACPANEAGRGGSPAQNGRFF